MIRKRIAQIAKAARENEKRRERQGVG